MLRKFCIINTCGREDCGNHQQDHEHGAYYLVQDVDAVLKRQAAAAIAGMNAATAISSGQLAQAHRLRAESSPAALESERQANAILTERIADLELAAKENSRYSTEMREEFERRGARIAELDAALAEAVGLFNAQKQMYEASQARIAELEGALRKIVETAAPTSHHANYCVVHRQLLGEARELMESATND